jgi:hypothetical protein
MDPQDTMQLNNSNLNQGFGREASLSNQLRKNKFQESSNSGLAEKSLGMAGGAMQSSGKTAEAVGKTTEYAGKGVEMAGKGLSKGGQAMMRTGSKLSGTGLGAIAGIPLMGLGAVASGAGKGAQAAGKGMEKTGQAVNKGGGLLNKLGKSAKGVSGSGEDSVSSRLRMLKSMSNKSSPSLSAKAKMVSSGINKTTSNLLYQSWLNLISSFGLTLIYINIHVLLRCILGADIFCPLGYEWADKIEGKGGKQIPKKLKDKIDSAGKSIGLIEVAVLLFLDVLVIAIVFMILVLFLVQFKIMSDPLGLAMDVFFGIFK